MDLKGEKIKPLWEMEKELQVVGEQGLLGRKFVLLVIVRIETVDSKRKITLEISSTMK